MNIAEVAISALKASLSSNLNNLALQLVFSFIFLTVSSALAKNSSSWLNIESSATPSKAAWIQIAVAAPPAPTIVIFLPITSNPASLNDLI